jgi:hypothetical protein
MAESKFERAFAYLERNATDDDIEVVFAVTSNEKGMATLRVIAPDGRTVVDFKAPDSKLGVRHVALETPEPPLNDGRVQADFPQGAYRFEGVLVDGETLRGEAFLSHTLPDATTITSPPEGRKDVPVMGTRVRWTAVKDAVLYVFTLEDEGETKTIKATLPAGTTSFNVPDGFMTPNTEYKAAVGAVLKGGSRTFVEIEFATGKK